MRLENIIVVLFMWCFINAQENSDYEEDKFDHEYRYFENDVEYSCSGPSTRNLNPLCIRDFAKNMTVGHQRNFSLRHTVRSINELMEGVQRATFRRAQITYNSTDEILDKLDVMCLKDSIHKPFQIMQFNNLVVQTFNVKTTDIAGLVVYQKENERTISQIYRNSTLAGVLAGGDFLAAAYLPTDLLNQIAAALSTPVVVITVFFKDILFVESEEKHSTSGIAFGVVIPDLKENFSVPLKLAYNVPEDGQNNARECAHWLYGADVKGSWKEDQATTICGTIEICEYYHVTHFAMLVLDSTDDIRVHKSALDTITFIGSLLSIIGFSIIYITGCLFQKWRENKGNIILINYAIASQIMILVMYGSESIKEKTVCDGTWCFWSGILLHYAVLAQFTWMLIISYLQYKRYVQVIGVPPTRLLLKSCLIGWVAPLPIVVIVGLTATGSYVRSDANLCYPSGLALYLGVLLPILLIVIVNIIVFVLIMRSIFHKSIEMPRLADNVYIIRTRLIVFLFFQLGLSWIFGFLGNFSIVFIYLFCITASSQGFVIFLIFIIFNEATKKYYKKMFGCKTKERQPKESSTRSTSFVVRST